MKKRGACFIGFVLMACLWMFRQAHAQDTIANVSQLAQQLGKRQ
jgi:hypothetical protein